MGLITSLDVSLSTKVSEDVRNFAVTTPELRIVTTAYTTRIVNMVAGCVPTAADIPVDTTSLSDKSITNLQRVAEVADAAQSAAAAAEAKSDEALAAATTAQSSADAAMSQAEAATDMAATNTLSISNILSNFTAWVLGTYLGALTLLDAAIAAGDSLQAMAGKLQGQLNAVKVRLGLLENKIIFDYTTTSDVLSVVITSDSQGNPLNLQDGHYRLRRYSYNGNQGAASNLATIYLNEINADVYSQSFASPNYYGINYRQGTLYSELDISLTIKNGVVSWIGTTAGSNSKDSYTVTSISGISLKTITLINVINKITIKDILGAYAIKSGTRFVLEKI